MDIGSSSVADEAQTLIETGLTMLRRDSAEVKGGVPGRSSHGTRVSRASADCGATRETQSIMSFFGAPGGGGVSTARRGDESSSRPRLDVTRDGANPATCGNCGSLDIVMHAVDSMRCCRECDAVEYIVIDNERPAKRDVPRDSTSFSFKRLSHFNEWLAQIQGKDHPSIPENVIGFVMIELKRNYINNAADVKTSQVRSILKKLKLSRYYEHVPYIIARIRGVLSERMPVQLEENLRTMFRKIQIPFVQNSPPTRKNFLSYGYVLHKFVQLLGHTEYLEKFPLLKSRDKLRVQDDIWRRICADLHWEFVPSV
jgi:Poxvirus Late Transcription Factor VLTF3 like